MNIKYPKITEFSSQSASVRKEGNSIGKNLNSMFNSPVVSPKKTGKSSGYQPYSSSFMVSNNGGSTAHG